MLTPENQELGRSICFVCGEEMPIMTDDLWHPHYFVGTIIHDEFEIIDTVTASCHVDCWKNTAGPDFMFPEEK